ncbi:MAG: GNAT family N-acetyltransferase [Lachnospiraceae bacterium]
MIVRYTDGTDSDFIELCYQLDTYLNNLVGGEENRAEYIPHNALHDIHDVWVAYESNVPIGCASYKKISSNTAELKRVFVCAEYRGNKIAEQLILELESKARQQGYRRLVLETGEPLIAATHLYRKLGYRVIDNYGPYVDMPESICMEKQLLDKST